MKLIKILSGIDYELVKGNIDLDVLDICYDSRKVTNNTMFVCLSGTLSDGHDYIDKSVDNGANVIIVEKDVKIEKDVTVIKVENTRKILSPLSINFFDNPKKDLTLIGITGTKGKTTTSVMIKSILEEAGLQVGLIGTMGVFYKDKHYDTVNTTPESYDIQKYLREMNDNGIKYVIMEVSSQALKVGRVEKLEFDYAIFTNLSKDHIGSGEHPTMEDYIYSKSLLFKQAKHGIFNIDDEHYKEMINNCSCDIHTFGKNKDADLVIDGAKLYRDKDYIGVDITLSNLINDTFKVSSPGLFSSYNATSAILTTYLLGVDTEKMKKALKKFTVRGRVEIVPTNKDFHVIIDYAHNGVSLYNILTTMKDYHPKRIVSLFGCGGNRSKDRRYEMGEVSGKLSDLTIITEDNSRYEDVNDIINDIETGIKKTNGEYIKIPDRREAISYAIKNATEGDIILILGKGHETYQEKNGVRTHFDDREEVLKLL